ncbi:GDSL esterase/lipase LIP-4-like [Asparagus officinalis]|uniref:GDSL esterase/lipase LIP-4-like n=1 Tax=Asparagus officinalis TaxID=4686 RepID=UPI00098E5028|nr:GDSL esterase/lipase LIP-4-like [Asparagus officinalis]
MGRGLQFIYLLTLLLLFMISLKSVDSKCVLFNFGDSNTDTGELAAGLGAYVSPPNGRLFFNLPAGRFCDGRLYNDFICESLEVNFLSPYLESSGSDFTDGVNFALAGAATEFRDRFPFPLPTQVNQFLHFKNRTRELRPLGKGSMISEEEFQTAVYSIDIGQNDIGISFAANLSYTQVINKIPSILSRIRDSMETIYESGGRKFWIYNTGPLGCLPQTLVLRKKNDSVLDSFGCLEEYNNASKVFNVGLSDLCDELRSNFTNATVVYIDKYSIRYDLVANHTKYGFEDPLMACCGYGGPPYNFKDDQRCGAQGTSACSLESRYISWDGIHNSEAANEIIAAKILSASILSLKLS